MKKFYHLLGIAFCSVMALSSCEEEKIVNENTGYDKEADKNLTDYAFAAVLKQPELLAQSDMQDAVYVWNEGEEVALWNRNMGEGYRFSVSSSQAGEGIRLTGKADLKEGHKVIAVYPYAETLTFDELGTFSMPEVHLQQGTTANLAESTFMVAAGEVENSQIATLNFSPLTALVQFRLTNTSDRDLKMLSVSLKSDDNIFPTELQIDESGAVKGLSAMHNSVTLDLGEQLFAKNSTLDCFLNIFPTTYGDIRMMTSNTKLNIVAHVLNEGVEQDIVLLKPLKVKDWVDKIGVDMEASAYQFATGKLYKMDLDVDYRFKVPEEGYLIDDEGNVHIYNKKGFWGWHAIAGQYRSAKVILEKDYIESPDGDGIKVIDLNNELWNPIAAFGGTFEGNGVIIRNLNIEKKGFIDANTGTIRNLTLENVRFANDVTEGAGALAATSTGVIHNCTVKNLEATVKETATFGGLVGRNSEAKIDGCSFVSGTITIDLAGKQRNSNYGGLVGEHFNGTALIINSYVGSDVKIIHPANAAGASCVGGLVGWNNLGKIKGCYSLATLDISCSAQTGGLVGANSNGTVLACYAAGFIKGSVSNNTGGLIAQNTINNADAVVTACYSTTDISVSYSGKKLGTLIGSNTKGVNACFSVGVDSPCVGNGSNAGVISVTVDQLKGKKRQMNLAVEAKDPELNFNFKVNDNPSTENRQPLVLRTAVKEPGFGGSDFGEGGEI